MLYYVEDHADVGLEIRFVVSGHVKSSFYRVQVNLNSNHLIK